jgi:transposase-like protein
MGWNGRERESHWQNVLARQASSGISVAEFCRRESISAPALYAWRRKLRGETGNSGDEGESPRRRASAVEGSGARLLPVRIESRSSASLRILLPGGVCVEAPCGMSPAALVEVVRALREGSPC